MDYKIFYEKLKNNRMITPIWWHIIEMINAELSDSEKKNGFLTLFLVYFSFINDGHTCMILDKDELKKQWNEKLSAMKILLSEGYKGGFDENEKVEILNKDFELIESHAKGCIDKSLSDLSALTEVVGPKKFFEIVPDNNGKKWLFLRKYSQARKSIAERIDKLFSPNFGVGEIDYKDYAVTSIKAKGKDVTFELTKGQEQAVKEGGNKNLIITGGPGTGKTTSIIFLLTGLLSKDMSYTIHLVAPSGKAASRMKDGIINNVDKIRQDYQDLHPEIFNYIKNLEESTIHRKLAIDYKTGAFKYNKNNQFDVKSIFVIDEASMIDVSVFSSLLQAIPDGARVFIMGDKNQLPSVECGAVLADLLERNSLKNNIIELNESKRFKSTTKVYDLAKKINEGQFNSLPVKKENWKSSDTFVIEKDDDTKPIFYYDLPSTTKEKKQSIEKVTSIWAKQYFECLHEKASDIDKNDVEYFQELLLLSEKGKILCAENKGVSGVQTVNLQIKKLLFNKIHDVSYAGEYAGEIMMVNTNNKLLDLYNGDSGILVKIKDDNTIYLMLKKSTALVREDGYKPDEIFKKGDYMFYPLRMISRKEIDLAYAISIHKSQGSDYDNILIVLPTKEGHPLLNRQIVYTAITRTKGNTYILANQKLLEEATKNKLSRNTKINI